MLNQVWVIDISIEDSACRCDFEFELCCSMLMTVERYSDYTLKCPNNRKGLRWPALETVQNAFIPDPVLS